MEMNVSWEPPLVLPVAGDEVLWAMVCSVSLLTTIRFLGMRSRGLDRYMNLKH